MPIGFAQPVWLLVALAVLPMAWLAGRWFLSMSRVRRWSAIGARALLFDPQTSGGLLIALAQKYAPRLVEELQANGVRDASTIGYATSLLKAWVRLV